MYCSKCGKELDDNAKFCSACGTSTTGEAAVSGKAIKPKRKSFLLGLIKGFLILVGAIVVIAVIIIVVAFMLYTREQKEATTVNNTTKLVTSPAKSVVVVDNSKADSIIIEINTYWDSICQKIEGYILEEEYQSALDEINWFETYFYELVDRGENVDGFDINLIEEKRAYIISLYIPCLEYKIYEQANTGNEDMMVFYLDIAVYVMDYDYYEIVRARAYEKYTLYMINYLAANGEATERILVFIDTYLPLTNYSCWVTEFWDYYFSVYMNAHNVEAWTRAITHMSGNQYFIDNSDVRYINEGDVSRLSRYELTLARFEIYARHGRTFSDDAINTIFNKCNWYTPALAPNEFDESCISDIERENIKFITNYEIRKGYRQFDTMNIVYKPKETIKPIPKQDSTDKTQASKTAPATQDNTNGDISAFISDKWFAQNKGEISGHGTRCTITGTGENNVKISTSYWGGMTDTSVSMTGTYDPSTGRINYSDAVSKGSGSLSDGSYSEWTDYTNGTGYFYLSGNSLIWVNNNEGSTITFNK